MDRGSTRVADLLPLELLKLWRGSLYCKSASADLSTFSGGKNCRFCLTLSFRRFVLALSSPVRGPLYRKSASTDLSTFGGEKLSVSLHFEFFFGF